MRIDAVDLFYARMPIVEDIGDGSQDALLIRVTAGGIVGWGECEASPLTSIAAFVAPMSHTACKPVGYNLLGQTIDSAQDIARLSDLILFNSMDLLQAPHTWSGVEMALWDLLGKMHETPVWQLLGFDQAHPKRAYASTLFGQTPQETFDLAQNIGNQGFTAAKFGWGGFGTGSVERDRQHLIAAREGLGSNAKLLVDAGQIWSNDVDAASLRLDALSEVRAAWLEEPFIGSDYAAYHALSLKQPRVPLAGGEASHSFEMACHLIDYGGVAFIQIDCGRIGGIAPAKKVADYARQKGVVYVNHTFTSHLALAASLQPYAGYAKFDICEYPVRPKQLALDITRNWLTPDDDGMIVLPEPPGLGMEVAPETLAPYLQEVVVSVGGETLFRSPVL